jgi:hypothetical protein
LLTASGFAAADIRYVTTADWELAFNGQITITNNGAAALRNWTLEFEFGRDIELIWDAKVVSREGDHYVIRSAGWNDEIGPGRTVTFGFGGGPGNVSEGPVNFRLQATEVPTSIQPLVPPAPGAVLVNIRQTSQSGDAFGAIIEVQNNGTEPLNGWVLSFRFDQRVSAVWNGVLSVQDQTHTIKNAEWNFTIPPRGTVLLGMTGSGRLLPDSAAGCILNGTPCVIRAIPLGAVEGPLEILIGDEDGGADTLQLTISQTTVTFPLRVRGQTVAFNVTSSNSAVVSAMSQGEMLQLTGRAAGRASLRIETTSGRAVRYIGVRVRNLDGSIPGMPNYLSLGSVSEDTPEHLEFWSSFRPGPQNKRVDARYIYLNGGPVYGWHTWGRSPASRAIDYIRNSKKLGVIPFFVFYNIPDGGESYSTDLAHVQDAAYMRAYFKNLKLALEAIQQEAPDDFVGMILEPDFLGYMAQNANRPASAIFAFTQAAYEEGVLSRTADPVFPNSIKGLVETINYTIRKYTPQVYFGWQVNLWASPAGGWTTSIPGQGLIRKTDEIGVAAGRPLIYREAAAITRYYLDAGVATHGARFLSIDKYGLDAAAVERRAAQDPATSTWFWNNDHWQNYLTFVRAMHETSRLPVILWQLPVGHINSSMRENPYAPADRFPDLPNSTRRWEDSTSTFFFGDTFRVSGARLSYFAANQGADPKVSVSGDTVSWQEHFADAAAAGVICAMFGAGVGDSTTNVGTPPTDAFWWISAAQLYYERPAPLTIAP